MPSSDPPHWTAFQAVAASVWKAFMRANQARLTGDQLRLVAFKARTLPRQVNGPYEEFREQLIGMSEDQLHEFGRELRRSTLVTAIGILDFCLFEVLTFMLSTHPHLKAKLPRDVAKRSLERTSINRRLDLVKELLGFSVDQGLVEELEPLQRKRNAIVHESKFYAVVPSGESVVMEAQPFPEVSWYESMMAVITVTEIADGVLVGVARCFFRQDLGLLRPLNPAVAEFNRSMRLEIQERRERGPAIETISDAGWKTWTSREGGVVVIDAAHTIGFSPTNLANFPLSVVALNHNVHGEKSYASVDGSDKEEIGPLMKPEFLARLLSGKCVLVEYCSTTAEEPLYVLFSLQGFPEQWAQAVAARMTLPRLG